MTIAAKGRRAYGCPRYDVWRHAMRAADRLHAIRIAIGLVGWALVVLDLTTNLLRDAVERVGHPIGPAVVPLALLLIITLLLWLRGPAKTFSDLLVAALAVPLVLFWHLPRRVYRPENPGPFLAYCGLIVDLFAHARSIFTFLVLFAAGATTLAARQAGISLVGAGLLAGALLFGVTRLVMRMVDPKRMLGVHARQIDKLVNQKPLVELLDEQRSNTDAAGLETTQLATALLGIGLTRIASRMLDSITQGLHLVLIVAHIVLIYFGITAALAAIHLGVYDTWPGLYASNREVTYFRFFAYTMLSTFNIPGSGIEPASIASGMLHWVAYVLLGVTGSAAAYSIVQTVRGKYVEVVRARSKELSVAYTKLDRRFKKVYGKHIAQAVHDVQQATELRGLSGFLASIIRFVSQSDAPETNQLPPNRRARRRQGKQR